jgi:hypothetical protein
MWYGARLGVYSRAGGRCGTEPGWECRLQLRLETAVSRAGGRCGTEPGWESRLQLRLRRQ